MEPEQSLHDRAKIRKWKQKVCHTERAGQKKGNLIEKRAMDIRPDKFGIILPESDNILL